jgi:hypothetical protein
MVLNAKLYKEKLALGDKARHAIKYIWANGYQHEKENQGVFRVMIWARFK